MQRTLAAIESGLEQGLHVGAQVYVSHRGNVVIDAGIGVARPSDALPMTSDTITLWLSSGKPITAVGIARLWERGLLDLDDPVARHVPEFASYGKEAITIRHILTHTAPLRLADVGWPHATWEQNIRRICNTRPEPRWVPGRTAGYSAHITWYLLGEIIQRLSGRLLADFLHDEVFARCGMSDTYVAMTPDEQAANAHRMAFTQQTDKGTPTDYGTERPEALAVPRPSGSVRGPAHDLGRFYETLLARDGRLISTQTIEAMTARHRVNTHDKTFNATIDWGLGFMINSAIYGHEETPYQYGPYASPRTFGHSGNQSSAGFADPENGLAVVVIFNGMAGEAKHQPRMRMTLGAVYEDLGLVAQA